VRKELVAVAVAVTHINLLLDYQEHYLLQWALVERMGITMLEFAQVQAVQAQLSLHGVNQWLILQKLKMAL
jgi:hypothetical protein